MLQGLQNHNVARVARSRFCNQITETICWFHRRRIISAASECGFLNIFARQNLLCCLSRLLFLLRWNKYGAKKILKTTFHWTFEMMTLSNQGAGKTIEKHLKELPWNQQQWCRIFIELNFLKHVADIGDTWLHVQPPSTSVAGQL